MGCWWFPECDRCGEICLVLVPCRHSDPSDDCQSPLEREGERSAFQSKEREVPIISRGDLVFLALVVLHHLTQPFHQVRMVRRLEGGGRYLGLLPTNSRSALCDPLWQPSIQHRHFIMTKHLKKYFVTKKQNVFMEQILP